MTRFYRPSNLIASASTPTDDARDRRKQPDTLATVKRYHVTTFGCQMNEHDSERMKGMLESLGYAEAPARDQPT